jgi:PhnB protein
MPKAIPEGFHTITPYIMVKDATRVVDFLKEAFDAEEISVVKQPDGGVWHATLKIGDSMIMIGNTMGKHDDAPCSVYLYVPNVDVTYKQAVKVGGTSLMEPADQFYGDRSAGVKDSLGNCWYIGTHIEDVSEEELQRRAEREMEKMAA